MILDTASMEKKCHYKHFPEKCQKDKCNDKNCTFRHPRTCKYRKKCKYHPKDVCAYDHVTIVHDDGKNIFDHKCNEDRGKLIENEMMKNKADHEKNSKL